MEKFEQEIGYEYKNKALMEEALTHSSYANEGKREIPHNERLEFLGDSVLSVVVAEHLFCRYRNRPEGDLTRLRAALVCEQSLFEFAGRIHLGEYLRLGRGEEHTGGRSRPSILSDAFEAVIASIYLDGGLEAARRFVLSFLPAHMDVKKFSEMCDYKTVLQELIQKNREERIQYVLVEESGPDHAKTFTIEVHLNSNVIGRGVGKSKKQAEQIAAREALALMGYQT